MTQVLRGQTLSFHSDPHIVGEAAFTHNYHGALVIGADGKILWHGSIEKLPDSYKNIKVENYGDSLILAGFIDAHLHFPQYRMLAAYAKDLLEWLNRYTFIEEQRYDDKSLASASAKKFIDELFRNGTTSCLAFSTIHPQALDALFEEAQSRGMALISGKTMMDINAPSGLCDNAQSAYDDSKKGIAAWHGRHRLRYAISPRFAVTSSEAQLQAAGTLAMEHPDLLLQTHLSESIGEIEFVASQFPWAKDYTDVYDHLGLLRKGSLFAHGIHLSERELSRLSEAQAAVVHCPTSNNFLGSGLFKLQHTANAQRPVPIGFGSDIGGGTSYSMLQTMRDAFTVSQLVGSRITAFDAFYLATLGNAKLLGLEHDIGNLEPGKMADVIVLNPSATPIMAERHGLSESLHDILFALLIMGDDRAVSQTYVAGRPMKP